MAVQNLLYWATLSRRDEAIQLAKDAIIAKPFLLQMPFMPIEGMTFRGSRAKVNKIGTSGINQGYASNKADVTPIDFKVANYSARTEVDVREADSFPSSAGGVNFFRSTQDDLTFEGILNGVADSMFNADQNANINDFFGLRTYMNSLDGDTVIDGGGTTADSQTSIYFVRWGALGVQGIFNESSGAMPMTVDMGRQLVLAPDGSGQMMTAYVTDFDWKVGIKVNDAGIGRLANIENAGDVTLANMQRIKRFIKNGCDAIFCNRNGASFLDQLSNNTLQTRVLDSELKVEVETFNGIPIFVDDSILDTEPVLV